MSERTAVVSPAYWSNFVSSFSIVIPFIIEFSCQVTIAKVSIATKNRYGEFKWIPCLTPHSSAK